MARTHMHSDLAARDTLPMTSGWKSDSVQNWPILFSTRDEILFLSKLISVLIKLESPAKNKLKEENQSKTKSVCEIQSGLPQIVEGKPMTPDRKHINMLFSYPTASWPLPSLDLFPEGS